MKSKLLTFLLALILIPAAAPGQVPQLFMELVFAGTDSVTVKLRLTNPGIGFTCIGIQAAVAYDPIAINPMPPPPKLPKQNIYNHHFASYNWGSFSNPLLEADLVDPDLSLYSEAAFGVSPVYIGPSQVFTLCHMMFFPQTGSGTTYLSYYGNTGANGITGYLIDGVIDMQAFAQVTGLPVIYFPVELSGFRAMQQGNAVAVEWTTASESNNYGFEVFRRFLGEDISPADTPWEKLDFVKGHGTTNRPISYLLIDRDVNREGRYQYQLKQIDHDGTSSLSPVTEVYVDLTPETYTLEQNYPNPVHASTGSARIRYHVAHTVPVRITVYDQLGREIQTLVDDVRAPGTYTATFHPLNFPSGLYYYIMTAGSYTSQRAMLLVR